MHQQNQSLTEDFESLLGGDICDSSQINDFEALFGGNPPGPEKRNAAPAVTGNGANIAQQATELRNAEYHAETADSTDFDAILGASLLDAPITVTWFKGDRDTGKDERTTTVRELARQIQLERGQTKANLRAVKFARFGHRRTRGDTGALRNNDNVLAVTGVESDHDAGTLSVDEAEARIRAAGLAALLVTTSSHREDEPHWRAFFPLSCEVPPNERAKLAARINGIFDGELDQHATFTLSQLQYVGAVEGGLPIETRLIDGRGVDVAKDLDAVALSKGSRRTVEGATTSLPRDEAGLLTLIETSETLHPAIIALAGKWAKRGETEDWSIERIRKAMLCVPVDQRDQRWWDRMKALPATVSDIFAKEARKQVSDPADDCDDLCEVNVEDKDTPNPSRLRFLSPGECAEAPSRGYVVKGFLAPGDVGCIYGAPGAGKSLISPYLGYAVAQGRTAFGMRTKQGRVFYVAAEDPHGMRGRVSALKLRHGDGDNFTLVEGVSDLLDKESPDFPALLSAVKEHKPSLIFIDTLAMAFPGLEENSADGMGRVVAIARQLASYGAAVVLIHHDTKAGTPTPRGHSLLNGALDVALQLFARDDQGVVRGKLSKNRNGACDKDIAFRIDIEAMGEDEDGDPIVCPLVSELDAVAAKPKQKLTPSERAAMSILSDMVRMSGECPVAEEDWRTACIEARTVSASEDRESRRKATKRAFEGLARKSAVILRNGTVMLPDIFPCPVGFDGNAFDDFPEEDKP